MVTRNVRTLGDLVGQVRQSLLSTQDTVCLERARLVTDAWRRWEHVHPAVRRARAFAHVLEHMTLDLQSNPVFAGNTSSRVRGWMLVPEHGFGADAQVLLENDNLEGMPWRGIPDDLQAFWRTRHFGRNAGVGHLAVDMQAVVHEGLQVRLDNARAQAHAGTTEQQATRQAMVTALQAVIDWAGRYAAQAEREARAEPCGIRRACLKRVARACRHVPARPARDLFEGLQAMLLVHLAVAVEGHGLSLSIGLPDRVLAHLAPSVAGNREAVDLVKAFMLRVAANAYQGRGSKTQAITVGGADSTGADCSNAVTGWFLEAAREVRLGDPHLFLRWHPALNPVFKACACESLAAGAGTPMLVSDGPTANGLVQAGVAPKDAWEYCVIGCNEIGIPGRSALSAMPSGGTIEYLGVLTDVLMHHPCPERIAGPGDLLPLMEATVFGRLLAMRRAEREHRRSAVRRVPTPFTSSLMQCCIERGRDLLTGMRYMLPCVYERGLTNAANALAAIEQVVFEQQAVTLSELVTHLAGNWPQDPVHRRFCAAPKVGTDDPRADRWVHALLDMRENALGQVDRICGDPAHLCCHVVRSLHRLDGARVDASPDGRRAGEPLCDSIGAVAGTAVRGSTAVLNSALTIDACRYYRGGYNLNLTLDKVTSTPRTIEALAESFLRRGGQELQVNCLDVAELRRAQVDPQRYQDLVVRIAGFSARFVDLSRAEQDELIARAGSAAYPGREACVPAARGARLTAGVPRGGKLMPTGAH